MSAMHEMSEAELERLTYQDYMAECNRIADRDAYAERVQEFHNSLEPGDHDDDG